MLGNYFKIALRNLFRNKVYGAISIFGLAVGITGAALLYLYIDSELSYDAFHENSDRIHRVVEINNSQERTRYFGQTAPVLGSSLEETFAEVADMVRLYQPSGHVNMEWRGERIHERNYLIADPGFFKVFDFPVIRGDRESPLSEPNSMVISERLARQYFGEENPIGQVLSFSNLGEVTVKAVIENVPDNSHLQFDLLFSRLNTNFDWASYLTSWGNNYGAYTYLLLRESVELGAFQQKLDSYIREQQASNENMRNFYLQPITDIYFGSANIEFAIESGRGNFSYIYLFSAIGIFLLLIAGINYTNLATALSVRRGREIGIRKAAGADRRQLVGQFLTESVVIALLATLLSAVLISWLLPSFNQLIGKEFSLDLQLYGYLGCVLLGIGLLVGLLSGAYPAFYLSLVKPIRVLKSKAEAGGGNVSLRKVLVVTQFCLSVILIIGTLGVYKQMNFIQSADLGFDKSQTLVIDINHGQVRSRFEAMKQEFERLPGVSGAAVSSRVPGEWKDITEVFARNPESGSADSLQAYYMSFDEDMLGLYDIALREGNNFSGRTGADSLSVILNRTAAEALNLRDPVGARLDVSGAGQPMRVIGVTENFHFQSLHQEVAPLVIGFQANPIRIIDYFSLKLAGGDFSKTIGEIKEVHRRFDPETAMEYHFLDEQIEQKYRAEQRAGSLFAIGGGITILIACLGLFGLALFATERRIREVGIRKILGASMSEILLLLGFDFLKLVGVAFLMAAPVSWLIMNNWLQNFAYRTDLGIGIFLLAGAGTLLVSLLTVSWQTIRAARLNPVDAIRSN